MTTATSWIRLAVALAAATAALAPRSVCAQSRADAQELFDEGRRLMTKGDFAQACEKFEASERIDPASGTELNLGLCRKQNKQLASAWAAYRAALATAKRRGDLKKQKEAHRMLADIEPSLLYLTIAVPEDARLDGLVIKRNGAAVDAELWNHRVPVDPDEYTISAEAPGYQPWSTSVVVKIRNKRVEVPPLQKRPPPPPAPRSEVRTAAAGPDEPSGAREPGVGNAEAGTAPDRWTGKRKLSLVLAAVGVVAGGAGIGLGLKANSLARQADPNCDATACKTPQAASDNRSAHNYAIAADIGFAAGGVAVVSAVALWLLGSPSSRDTVAVVPTLDATHFGVSFARSF
ncbi:MAG TPA: hypothetical protein VHT91_43265 [Kofleriaceae bacterium]|jgi:tetratricopeptide (TPR) repeat protein|nr:hypothetical protein [Kofleriaceae bacterium]